MRKTLAASWKQRGWRKMKPGWKKFLMRHLALAFFFHGTGGPQIFDLLNGLFDLPQDIDSGKPRHAQIERNQIDIFILDDLKGLIPVGRRIDLINGFENHPQRFPGTDFIIHDQYTAFLSHIDLLFVKRILKFESILVLSNYCALKNTPPLQRMK